MVVMFALFNKRKCCNGPNTFCYICGNFILKDQDTTFSKKLIFLILKSHLETKTNLKLGEKCAKPVFKYYNYSIEGGITSLSLICQCFEENTQTILITATSTVSIYRVKKHKQHFQYADIPSANLLFWHCEEIPVQVFGKLLSKNRKKCVRIKIFMNSFQYYVRQFDK